MHHHYSWQNHDEWYHEWERHFPHIHRHLRPWIELQIDSGFNDAHTFKLLWRAIKCLSEAQIDNMDALRELGQDLGRLLQVIEEEIKEWVISEVMPPYEDSINQLWKKLATVEQEIEDLWKAIHDLGLTTPPDEGGGGGVSNMMFVELNTPFAQIQALKSPITSTNLLSNEVPFGVNASFYEKETGITFGWTRHTTEETGVASALAPTLYVFDTKGKYIKQLIPSTPTGFELDNHWTIDDVFVSIIRDPATGQVQYAIEIAYGQEELVLYLVNSGDALSVNPSQTLTQWYKMIEYTSQATYNHPIGAPTLFSSLNDFMETQVIISSYSLGSISKGSRYDLYNNFPLTPLWEYAFKEAGLTTQDINTNIGDFKATANEDGKWLVIGNASPTIISCWWDKKTSKYVIYETLDSSTFKVNFLNRLYEKTNNFAYLEGGGTRPWNNQWSTPNTQIVEFSTNFPQDDNLDLFIGLSYFSPSDNQNRYVQFTNQGWSSSIQGYSSNSLEVTTEWIKNGTSGNFLACYYKDGFYTLSDALLNTTLDKPIDIISNDAKIPPVSTPNAYVSLTGQTLGSLTSTNSKYTGFGAFAGGHWYLKVSPFNSYGYQEQVLIHAKTPIKDDGTPFDPETTVFWKRTNKLGLHFMIFASPVTGDMLKQQIGQWQKIDFDEWTDWRNSVNARLREYGIQFNYVQGDVTNNHNEIVKLKNTAVADHLQLNGTDLTLTRKLLDGTVVSSDTVSVSMSSTMPSGTQILVRTKQPIGNGNGGTSATFTGTYDYYEVDYSIGGAQYTLLESYPVWSTNAPDLPGFTILGGGLPGTLFGQLTVTAFNHSGMSVSRTYYSSLPGGNQLGNAWGTGVTIGINAIYGYTIVSTI